MLCSLRLNTYPDFQKIDGRCHTRNHSASACGGFSVVRFVLLAERKNSSYFVLRLFLLFYAKSVSDFSKAPCQSVDGVDSAYYGIGVFLPIKQNSVEGIGKVFTQSVHRLDKFIFAHGLPRPDTAGQYRICIPYRTAP